MSNKFILYIFFLFASLNVFSQTYEENILMGDEAFSDADYYSASVYYHNALYIDSVDIKVCYKYADACRLFNNYTEAAHWYEYVINNSRQDYPICRFWLALMLKSCGKYYEAGENFQTFLSTYKKKDDYFYNKASVEIKACKNAKEIIDNKLPVSIDHVLATKVNTSFTEFNPVQIGSEYLYFSSLRPISDGDFETFMPNAYVSKIYFAKNTPGGWANVKEFDDKINDKETHNANVSFSANHKKVYFTRSRIENNPTLTSEIFVSDLASGKWQKPYSLGPKINIQGYTSTHPHIVNLDDYDVLYFASDRPGGFGKMDIWFAIIKDGKVNDPVNCGSIINTMGEEVTPFYVDSNKTMFFSSDWHQGLGGFDVFKSKGGLSEWTVPENIGYPLNSSANDLYFSKNEIDKDGYFTSNRPGSLYIKSETCCNDIYYYEWKGVPKKLDTAVVVKKDTVKINIVDSIKLLLPLTLYFHNDEPDPRSNNISTKRNYKATLSEYYDMEEKYRQEYSKDLTGADKIKAENDIDDFFNSYVAKGFNNLKLFSKLLLLDLERGHKVQIKIKGYCSPLNTTEYNFNLAKRRISSLVNYINEYDEGVFKKYLNSNSSDSGKLIITEDPIGKALASPFVSDNPNDQRNSVYSRAAALERKIQIILYESESAKAGSDTVINYPSLKFEKQIYDLGKIKKGEKFNQSLFVENAGDGNLIIQSIETSSAQLSVDYSSAPISPGGKTKITIHYTANASEGEKTEIITFLTNSKKGKDILTFKAFIIDK